MTYELAKKLKDAGFPYSASLYNGRIQIGSRFLTSKDIQFFVENEETKGEYSEADCAVKPTLSELIAACGDRLGKLTRVRLGEMVNWNAFESYPQTLPISNAYSTPEEAVANLWLAIKSA